MKQKLFFEVDEKNGKQGSIRNRFLISPFSILDTKSGDWRKRRNNWKDLGLKSDEGRGEELVFSVSFDKYGTTKGKPRKQITQGTSVFDPVLCELMYTWFCPAGGQVVDPFCGGSVRGIVAAMLGYSYWGIDIREEQVTANRKQYAEICDGQKEPEWILGDSTVKIKDAPRADFVLSCPPYGDLEKYSDNPKDLSNMSYENFMAGMKKVIQGCYDCLKRNSFACFVISDYRDKSGNYSGFMPDTINAFKAEGLPGIMILYL